MAVVAAVELDDVVATRESASETNGRHRRLGAGIHHPHHFYGWYDLDDEFGDFDFDVSRRPEAGAPIEDGREGVYDGGGAMTQHHRSP